jgi:hypothetical protein
MAKIRVKSGREYDCGSESPSETVEAIEKAIKRGSFCVVCGNDCVNISEIEAVIKIVKSDDDDGGENGDDSVARQPSRSVTINFK